MRIPYVIDNRDHRLAQVLNDIFAGVDVRAMDIATAYFTIGGYDQIAKGLKNTQSFRLLIGEELKDSKDVGMRPRKRKFKGLLRDGLADEPFDEKTLRLVEDLIEFLQREDVAVRLYQGDSEKRRRFLHAKCYLMYGGVDRFNPLVGIVGSSNFTRPGLTTNLELNTAHKTLLEPEEVDDPEARHEISYLADVSKRQQLTLETADGALYQAERRLIKSEAGARAIMDLRGWYDEQWELSTDFKEEFIDLLWSSKFGGREYTPYEVYMKALYEYFRDDLGDDAGENATRTAIELSEFQEDAVRKARQILRRYDGVMIADSVGLGKTWIGKRLLEDYAYHMRQKALVICPAGLRSMWERELQSATIAGRVISQEVLGREEYDITPYSDVDVILIDEAHNFRNRNAGRYGKLEELLSANGRRGRDGQRKKVILLTATPINNNVFDLYNQINLFTGNDMSYFAAAGIADLRRYFLAARKAANDRQASVELFNLLEEVVVRRTRPFIRTAYENATIAGKPIRWPKRRLRTVEYNLERTYEGIYAQIVRHIEGLNLAHYNLADYKIDQTTVDEFDLGREQALVGIFKSRFLKRFESSVAAFRISVRRALQFIKTFESELHRGRLLNSSNFRLAVRFLESEDEDDDALPRSRSSELQDDEEATAFLDTLESLDTSAYNIAALHDALQADIEALTEVWQLIRAIKPEQDAKLAQLKELLGGELQGKKVLIFSYYRDTVLYLERELAKEQGDAFRESIGNPRIRCVHGGDSTDERDRAVKAFAPRAHDNERIIGTDAEIDILIATDALSEGQNLQDAGFLLNYDLHWNPTRMVQRAGRIDRIGTLFDELWIYNMFPDKGLERLLGLVKSLMKKIETINDTGFLDASVLGEVVNPRNFNTLRSIRDEDESIIEEEESLIELASSEALMRELQQQLLNTQVREWLQGLPDGIHSGLHRERAKGVFFYFTTSRRRNQGRQHFWRYYDIQTRQIMDNRYLITDYIRCQPDTPRVTGEDEVDIFDIQEQVIVDVVKSSQEQVAIETAPKQIDPIQQNIITSLRTLLNAPSVDRKEIRQMMKFIGQPLPNVHVKMLRRGFDAYVSSSQHDALVEIIREIQQKSGAVKEASAPKGKTINRDDLHLICFDYVWS